MHIQDVCVCINTHREACTLWHPGARPRVGAQTHEYARLLWLLLELKGKVSLQGQLKINS